MKNIIFLTFLLTTFVCGSETSYEPKQNSKPIFMISVKDKYSHETKVYYYEVDYMRLSKNYLNLNFSHVNNKRSSFLRPKQLEECLKTSSWGESAIEMNLLTTNSSNSKLSLIFERGRPGPKPYPLPLPLPFKLSTNSDKEIYQMEHREVVDGRMMSEEITTVRFMSGREKISSKDLYDEGFTDFVPCSRP